MLAFYQRLSRTVCSRAISRKREFRIMLGVSRLEVAMFALLTAYPRGYVFVAERGSRDDEIETNVHRLGGDPCLSRTRVLGFGGSLLSFSQPALTALAIATFVISGISVFSGGNMSPGEREDRANRWGHCRLRVDRAVVRLPASLHRPNGFLDFRWRDHSLAWRCPLYRRWRAATPASLCARPSVQQVGSDPVGSYARHEWCLGCHPPPKLSRIDRASDLVRRRTFSHRTIGNGSRKARVFLWRVRRILQPSWSSRSDRSFGFHGGTGDRVPRHEAQEQRELGGRGQMQGQWSQRSGRCGSMSVSSQQVEKGDALPDADAPLSPVRATCDGTFVTFFVDWAAFSRDLGQSKCVTLVP